MKNFYSQTIIFSFLTAIFLSSCIVSEKKENDLINSLLKGNIRHMINTTYYASSSFGEIEKDTLSRMSVLEKEFNKYGNLTMFKKTKFNSDNISSFSHFKYLYNKNQDVIELIEYNDVGNKVGAVIYILDEIGNTIKSTKYDEDGDVSQVRKMEYDQNKQLEFRQIYESDGTESISYKYYYDKQGNVVKKMVFYASGKSMYRYSSNYDLNNNLIAETKYDIEEERFVYKKEFKFNNDGCFQIFYSEINYSEEGEEEYWSIEIDYDEVDEKGNWITAKRTTSKERHTVSNKKIEYYK